ncbi:HU family DNA-binding protein [Fusobacterium varium]|jgi:DNA-binding protein HU-beta|uniref:HU family DNA-binding protein n=1 Tax=Fusobacterium varium TaxID=856 RepID=UPI00241F1B88|nr:HU family DNA-binding protein [Fusobacterium varium]
MTEVEFIKFYRERNNLKSIKEAKEKIDLFWSALLKALDEDGKVILKNWGVFEKKEAKPKKMMILKMNEIRLIEGKEKIRFRIGTGLRNLVNGDDIFE